MLQQSQMAEHEHDDETGCDLVGGKDTRLGHLAAITPKP